MNLTLILCLVFSLNVNCNQWDQYHRQLDDNLPAISWKDCGISSRKSDPTANIPEVTTNVTISSRIESGEFAESGEFPWFALIRQTIGTQRYSCGGSILNEWWVMTAAHCVERFNPNEYTDYEVLIGSVERNPPSGVGRRIKVERVVSFPNYAMYTPIDAKRKESVEEMKKELMDWEFSGRDIDEEFLAKVEEYKKLSKTVDSPFRHNDKSYFDIALLKLKERIVPVFNESHYIINSICLPKYGIYNKKFENLVIIGMGSTGLGQGISPRLKKGVTLIPTYDYCSRVKHYPTLCTLLTNRSTLPLFNATQCHGDSGSPSHQYYGWKAVQIGIAKSAGYKNGRCGFTGTQIRISFFMPWIRAVISGTDIHVEEEANDLMTSEDNLLVFSVIITGFIAIAVYSALFWVLFKILNLRQRNQ